MTGELKNYGSYLCSGMTLYDSLCQIGLYICIYIHVHMSGVCFFKANLASWIFGGFFEPTRISIQKIVPSFGASLWVKQVFNCLEAPYLWLNVSLTGYPP